MYFLKPKEQIIKDPNTFGQVERFRNNRSGCESENDSDLYDIKYLKFK